MKLNDWGKRTLWWSLREQEWRPIAKDGRLLWMNVKPRYFTAHDLAMEMQGTVKYQNVYLLYLFETGYLERTWYSLGRFSDVRIHHQKQKAYWGSGENRGRSIAGKRRKRGCYWHYVPNGHALDRFFEENGFNVRFVDDLIFKVVIPLVKHE